MEVAMAQELLPHTLNVEEVMRVRSRLVGARHSLVPLAIMIGPVQFMSLVSRTMRMAETQVLQSNDSLFGKRIREGWPADRCK